jgi:hypothetical protein
VGEGWLEIKDEAIDGQAIAREIRERVERRVSDATADPAAVADAAWQEVVGRPILHGELVGGSSLWEADCEIVPQDYAIDWRMPILGPLHALVRKVINDEIRRYLSRSLDKQSYLNRQLAQAVQALAEENRRLRLEIEELGGDGADTPV